MSEENRSSESCSWYENPSEETPCRFESGPGHHALQAPTGGNTQGWHFVVVQDQARRAALADLYRRAWKIYKKSPGSVFDLFEKEPPCPRKDQLGRVCESADYLVDNLELVPVHVIPCIHGRVERMTGKFASVGLASVYGSILPATWSFMLAARERGLGTAWTTCPSDA